MFQFNHQILQPFDIILVRFPGDAISDSIRKACNSQYSHAIVYIGQDVFIEGVDPIVSLFSTYRYYFKDLDNIKILRLREQFKHDFDVQKAETLIRSLSYCNYSRKLLVYIKNKNLPNAIIETFRDQQKWIGGIVCTTLVTLPYFIGGIDLTQSGEPFYASFLHLESDYFFEDITHIALVESTNVNKEFSFDYFSMQPTGSIQEKQSEAVLKLNNHIMDLFSELDVNRTKYEEIRIEDKDLEFSTWEDIYPLLMRWYKTETGRKIDEELYQEIIKVGYNNLWLDEVHNSKQLFFPIYYFKDKNNFEPIEHYQFVLNSLNNEQERIERDKNAVNSNFSQCPNKTFHILSDMYRSFLEQINLSISQYEFIIANYTELINP